MAAHFNASDSIPEHLGQAAFLKMLLLPLIAAGVCKVLGISGPTALVACFYCALPTAQNAYLMAKEFGGDARLMASLITTQTLLAPLALMFSQQLGGGFGAPV